MPIHFTGKNYICILFQLKISPFFTFGETQGGACLKAWGDSNALILKMVTDGDIWITNKII